MQSDPVIRGHIERRSLRRFPVKLPVAVRVSGIPYEFRTETENVSANGVFFYIDRWMSQGARLELTMHFASQVTMTEPLEVRLQARVVRVVPQGQALRSGVAAFIEAFQFLPSAEHASAAPAGSSPTEVIAR